MSEAGILISTYAPGPNAPIKEEKQGELLSAEDRPGHGLAKTQAAGPGIPKDPARCERDGADGYKEDR